MVFYTVYPEGLIRTVRAKPVNGAKGNEAKLFLAPYLCRIFFETIFRF